MLIPIKFFVIRPAFVLVGVLRHLCSIFECSMFKSIVFVCMFLLLSGCAFSGLGGTSSEGSSLTKEQMQRLQSLASVEITRKDDISQVAWIYERESRHLLWKLQPEQTTIDWMRPGTYQLIVTDTPNNPTSENAQFTEVTLTLQPGRHHRVDVGIVSQSDIRVKDILSKAGSAVFLIVFSVSTGLSRSVMVPSVFPGITSKSNEADQP